MSLCESTGVSPPVNVWETTRASDEYKFGGDRFNFCICPICKKLGGERWNYCVCPHCKTRQLSSSRYTSA
jgi:hypothetical protein